MGGVFSTNQHRTPPTTTQQRATTIGRTTALQQPQYEATTTTIASSIPTAPKSYYPAPSHSTRDRIEDLQPALVHKVHMETLPLVLPLEAPTKNLPLTPRPLDELLPSLSLASNERGVPLYTLHVSDKSVCFFVPDKMEFIEKARTSIALEDIVEGAIYLVDDVNRQVTFSTPSPAFRRKLVDRNAFVCGDTAAYRSVILPGLVLGSRVRDFEQRCASVLQMGELVLSMSSQRILNLKKLKLRTIGDDVFNIDVKAVQKTDTDKRWIVACHEPTEPLPSGLKTGDLLEIMDIFQQQPRVTDALMHFCQTGNRIVNWPLLECIYGLPSHLSLPRLDSAHPVIQYAGNGGLVPLNAEQKEAVARYNSSCPGFGIEAPPGSGKTLTAAAMAVSYAGGGIQLFLSPANVPVFNMALQLAKLDYGSRSPIHLMSAESEEKGTEETRSPFSSLSLARNQENMREQIEALERELKHAPNVEEKDELRQKIRNIYSTVLDQPHNIYFATVDTILGRYFKKNQGGRHQKDPVKKQLTTNVKRIVVDEASQLTEAALNALILCFPQAQIVLIGDSKQLPPFRYQSGEVVSELTARPALDVIKDKANLPVIKLRRVYRASPSLIAHYSDVFYGGALISDKKEAKNPLGFFGKRAGGSRCLFWKVNKGKSITPTGSTSKVNNRELRELKYLVDRLRSAGIDEKDVMIISYYEAQRKRAEQLLPGYEVLTVDSAQGREKRVVIVLTTRTSVPTDPDSFFLNAKRRNVAMSRHKEALIVIGHSSVSAGPNWAEVLAPKYFHHVEDDNGSK